MARSVMRTTLGQQYVKGFAPDAINREVNDFYSTPSVMTEALLSVEKFEGSVWEPACGNGAISRVLESNGYNVKSTDLIERGYGLGGYDFLLDKETKVNNIITNPPFKLMEEFINNSLSRTDRKVAILGRLALLEGQGRRKIWDKTPISKIWVFSKRYSFLKPGESPYGSKGGKGGMIASAWFVWEHGYTGRPTIGWI